MQFKRIVIIGLGLMGGSLAAACRRHFPHARVLGISRSRAALAAAKKRGWIHEGFQDLEEAFVGTHGRASLHLVVLCTPVDTFQDYLRRLDRVAAPGTIVTDTGSVKGFLIRWAERQNWRRIEFVGAHPMAGSHRRGIEAADPHLFDQSLVFVTPSTRRGTARRTSPTALKIVKNFWRKICSRAVVLSAPDHDRMVSEISHLPHAVAACLVLATGKKALGFAGTGFCDTTRIAQGHPSIWVPIFRANRGALRKSLAAFEKKLEQFRRALSQKRDGSLQRIFAVSARKRGQITEK